MVRELLAAALLCAITIAGGAQAEETAPTPRDPARLAAARDLLEVTGVSKQLDGVVEAMKAGFEKSAKSEGGAGSEASAAFNEIMQRLLGYKQDMITDFATLYAEMFTEEEMKAVADFYRTGAGAKFISMTPELMQKGAAIGMKYSDKIVKATQELRALEQRLLMQSVKPK